MATINCDSDQFVTLDHLSESLCCESKTNNIAPKAQKIFGLFTNYVQKCQGENYDKVSVRGEN